MRRFEWRKKRSKVYMRDLVSHRLPYEQRYQSSSSYHLQEDRSNRTASTAMMQLLQEDP